MQASNFSTYYQVPYAATQACEAVTRTPIAAHGMDLPFLRENYRNPMFSDAVQLNLFQGTADTRTPNAPSRDEEFFGTIVESRPIVEFVPPVTRQANNVPAVWATQVGASRAFDLEREEIYTNQSYAVFCTEQP
jgi:hypothetical protein